MKYHTTVWNLHSTAITSTQNWQKNHLGAATRIPVRIRTFLETGEVSRDENGLKLSLAQQCELMEQQSVFKLMNGAEQIHLQASMGPTQVWVNMALIGWKTWKFASTQNDLKVV